MGKYELFELQIALFLSDVRKIVFGRALPVLWI
jgi:hypothetical protein